MSEQKESLFMQLYGINVNEKTEKKGQLTYLSWVFAHAEMKKVDENAITTYHEFPYIVGDRIVEGVMVPYLLTAQGAMVKVSVTIKGKTETEWLPVMDHKNQTMMQPKATDINKAHKRCFAKAVALHGLGLYVYAGDDLPEDVTPKATEAMKTTIKSLVNTLSIVTNRTPKEVFDAYEITADLTPDDAKRVTTELRKAIDDAKSEDNPRQAETAEEAAMKDVEMEVNGNA